MFVISAVRSLAVIQSWFVYKKDKELCINEENVMTIFIFENCACGMVCFISLLSGLQVYIVYEWQNFSAHHQSNNVARIYRYRRLYCCARCEIAARLIISIT